MPISLCIFLALRRVAPPVLAHFLVYLILVFCTVGGLAAKVVRNDSLAKFLSTGRQRREQQDRSILPQRTEAERKEFRQAIGTQLNR